ncbi:MAG: hypothetical protein Q9198_007821 [Flavoplaca austrocitrina]
MPVSQFAISLLYVQYSMTEPTRPESNPAKPKPSWHPVTLNHIPSLIHVAARIHPGLPESDHVFAERVKLFPAGCLALVQEGSDELCGYLISHPIRYRQPPALDSLLEEIAEDMDQYYIHDLALLPEWRGCGFTMGGIERVFGIAKQYQSTCLVSVYKTELFWARYGFRPVEIEERLEEKVRGYGEGAKFLEREN